MKGTSVFQRPVLSVFLIVVALCIGSYSDSRAQYFSDNMDTATSWTADSPWARTTSAYHSPSAAWTDSPGTYYGSQANISLTMVPSIDLSSATNPKLVFWHKYQLETNFDFGYVEISADGGTIWVPVPLAAFTGISDWKREQIDLSAYAGSAEIKIRFRLKTDKDVVWDGWTVDDVVIAEPPPPVYGLTITNPLTSSLDLSWEQSLDPDFASYNIFRSTSPGVTMQSTPVTTISSAGTVSYRDTGLTPGAIYYYKIFVFDTAGLSSESREEFGMTIATAYGFPFSDNMESGVGGWLAAAPWALTTGVDRTGQAGTFWSDSPGGVTYANDVNKALAVKLNLSGAVRPILRFWQRYNLEEQEDFGFVEISTDNGSTWSVKYLVTGFTSTHWEEAAVDLTRWANQQIQLRFRIDEDTNGMQYDGWEIDDVSVTEAASGNTPYPFVDGFDSEASFIANWIATNRGREFVWRTSDGHGAAGTVYYYPPQNVPVTGTHSLILAKPVDLTTAVRPQLTFWHKYRVYNSYNLYVSIDGGRTWVEMKRWYNYVTQSSWRQEQVDLSAYAGLSNLLVMFQHSGYDDWDDAYWYIDDVRIGEDPTVPSFIQKVSGDGQTGQTGTALAAPFTARVLDSDSRPKSGVLVNFTVAGGGNLSAASATSDAQGMVSTLLTLGSVAGANTVTATIDGTTQSVTFSAAGFSPGQAMTIARYSGDNQVNAVNLALGNPLVVRVTDVLGNPVAETNVTFSIASGGGTLGSTAQVATNGSGLASNTLVLGTNPGMTVISASNAALMGSPVSFTAHAVLPGGVLGDTDGDGMPDTWETAHGLNPLNSSDAVLDPDADTLTNLAEYARGTDPNEADSDHDGMPDDWEIRYGLNPLNPADAVLDFDGDGISNLQEYLDQTVPVLVRHFQIAGATSQSMDFYGAVAIDNGPAQMGDEVAVLDPDGVICGQFTVSTPGQYGFMHVYRDDPSTAADEGAEPGDELFFKLWDADAGVEIDAAAQVVTGTLPPAWTADGDVSRVNLAGASIQSIPLHTGWNLVSFSVKTCFHEGDQPTEPMLSGTVYQAVDSIGEVFSSIAGLYEVVRSFDSQGAHSYVPDPEMMPFNDLKYIAGGYGYWIKMNEPGNLEVQGLRAQAGDGLELRPGWNLVGYWHPGAQYAGNMPLVEFPPDVAGYHAVGAIDEIVDSIGDNYFVIRSHDINGAHTYDPLLGTFNDLRYLGPGYGMWVKMRTAGVLRY